MKNMKKIFFSVLVLMTFVMALGVVNATVDFVAPLDGDYIGNSVLVSWENGTYATSNLMYHEGVCDGSLPGEFIEMNIDAEDETNWDVSEFDDGFYCLKIADGTTLHANITVTIDNTAPEIEFINSPYFIEVDVETDEVVNITDDNGIGEWSIDFGDGSAEEEGTSSGEISLQHTYEEEGKYIITVTATDEAGNEAVETTAILVNEEEPDWIIPLYAEEPNFFSIPLMPESTDIEDVLPEEISDNAVKIWSYQEGEWKYNTPTTSGWSTTSTRIQEIVPGYGYIIFMNNNAVTYGDGDEGSDPLTPTNTIELTAGWNLIGLYGTANTIVSDALAGLISVSSGTEYWSRLQDSELNSLNLTDTMEPTKAYWIDMNANDFEDPEDKIFLY